VLLTVGRAAFGGAGGRFCLLKKIFQKNFKKP